jgi:hypothetical protein
MKDPKYTRDQKRRAVQEIVKRLEVFDDTMKLIRQFDITEQDLQEYLGTRVRNDHWTTYDPYTGRPQRVRSIASELEAEESAFAPYVPMAITPSSHSLFDQAVEEATELFKRAFSLAAIRSSQLQGLLAPHPSLKSYTDWA